ncbi:MAG TPA: hypothetical protein IAC81_04530 [Candidatus Scatomorpha stercorigallinarum]|nr:hypothetical protein [Candidatus Scatomorpha stercorigallinarum]
MNSKNNLNALYLVWAVAIVACLLVVLFSLLFASLTAGSGVDITTAPPSAEGEGPAPDGPSAPAQEGDTPASAAPGPEIDTSSAALLGETEDAGQAYIDRLTFLGDSTTNGLKEYGVLSGGTATTQVWTPASGTLTLYLWNAASIVYPETGAEMTIADAVETKKPEYLVITLGVNGVAELEEDAFKIYYTDIINCVKEASPSTRIICNSIYPVENDYEHIDQISNEKINTANGWILDVAEATGTRYADSCSVLKAADGSLREELGNGDGLHLNADGYNAVLEYLRTHAWQ